MILYHASNMMVKEPAIVAPSRLLDFGHGFYTTTNRVQAERFASSVVRKRGGRPMINVYECDIDALRRDCHECIFDSPSDAWLDFVAAHRSGKYVGEEFDVVTGPVANDNVYTTIGLYVSGVLSREATIAELRVRKLYDQMVFCSPLAISHLVYLDTEVLP